MSYRELRNLTEIMRALGYPRPISVDNFRTPNFELVSDLLFWMVKKYDPSSNVADDIDTEDDRINFVTQATSAVYVKARILLNPKRLYAADGLAVKELIKLAQVLYQASRIDSIPQKDQFEDDDKASVMSIIGSRIKDPNTTRGLSKDIMQSGAKLYDLLQTELQVRDARQQALRFLDAIGSSTDNSKEQRHLERSLNEIVKSTLEAAETSERQFVELEAEEKALNSKIIKAQTDLERSEKRLRSLRNVRPAFMEEYEKLERDLERQYALYCERFRNLDYLQRELDSHHAHELKKLAESDRALKKIQKRFRDDELAILRGEQEDPLESSFAENNSTATPTHSTTIDKKHGEQVSGAQRRTGGDSTKRGTSKRQAEVSVSDSHSHVKAHASGSRRPLHSESGQEVEEDNVVDSDVQSSMEEIDDGEESEGSNEDEHSDGTLSDSEEVSLADSADMGEGSMSDDNFGDSQSGSSQSISVSDSNSDQDF